MSSNTLRPRDGTLAMHALHRGGKVLDDNIALSYDVVFISSTRQSVGKPRHRINKCVSEIPVTATVIVSRFES